MNLLNEASDCRFVTRKWNILSNQLNVNYDGGNEIMYNPEVLKSNTCGYNDAYILVRGNITINRCNQAIPVAFKNCAQFIKCMTNWWNNDRCCWRFRLGYDDAQFVRRQLELFWHDR